MKITYAFKSVLLVAAFATMISCQDRHSDAPVDPNGKDVTVNVLSKNGGRYVDLDAGEILLLNRDRSFSHMYNRAVDEHGGSQKSQAKCNYLYSGTINKIIERSDDLKSGYMEFATHYFDITVNQVELLSELDAETPSKGRCRGFLRSQTNLLPMRLQLFAEIIDENHIRLHTKTNNEESSNDRGNYRSASTLDEIYTRRR